MARFRSGFLLVLLWTAVGLVFASAGAGIRQALTVWYIWGLLAWAMAAIDRRLPVPHQRIAVRLAWHVPLSLLFSLVDLCLNGAAAGAANWHQIAGAIRGGGIQWNLLNYWLILGAWLAFDYRRRAAYLETLLTEARLSALRAQLNPHFLFNALNTVSAYVENDPRRARAMLGHLGDLLRFSLDTEDRHEVRLAEEIEALHHYLAIQCARFAERLQTQIDIPGELLDARVPGLLLQPLVENAITHGLSPLPGVGKVRIAARAGEGYLTLTVTDNGAGLPAGWSLDGDAGIGLSNTRSRLAETYGSDHHFLISPAAGGGVIAEVRIPLAVSPSVKIEDRAQTASADRRR